MLSIRKEIRVSTQHIQDIKRAIDINTESDYNYIIVEDNTLIGLEGLKMLLKVGYEINPYAEHLEFWHKNYKADKVEK
jgi:hypothetical protein